MKCTGYKKIVGKKITELNVETWSHKISLFCDISTVIIFTPLNGKIVTNDYNCINAHCPPGAKVTICNSAPKTFVH